MTSSFEFFFGGASTQYAYFGAAERERAGYLAELTGGLASAASGVELLAPESATAGAS